MRAGSACEARHLRVSRLARVPSRLVGWEVVIAAGRHQGRQVAIAEAITEAISEAITRPSLRPAEAGRASDGGCDGPDFDGSVRPR
ncbi:hypothetical protein GCM10025865_05080 [Paraoerskovia sediminicola]|uniref:LysR substrate binding domain-containing protein n=1 Tax=Paraoerskovia sediminicola TaxID=1138587 RepID=A0ABN6X905_9CELL|nr:hypothetical protein GCM10025865_05080 [Paraoerskovia sediminicola]